MAQIQSNRAERRVLKYVPLPLYHMARSETSDACITQRFRLKARVDFVQLYRRTTLKKMLLVTPKDPTRFNPAGQQRMDATRRTEQALSR